MENSVGFFSFCFVSIRFVCTVHGDDDDDADADDDDGDVAEVFAC